MQLIGNKPPKKWPISVFWILVAIHLPVIAWMILTSIVHGTILNMITFWMVTVPLYVLSLLADPLRLTSAVIAAYLIWYACQFNWYSALNRLSTGQNTFVRGRRILTSNDFRSRLASRRMTVNGRAQRRNDHISPR